ncbi:transporter substrate-binding domain-containing protein [Pseudomonas abietaniphila]|uniref:Polar amino acid transport system substrate-binding protein n=1 Tax=Pseudomonas abietaniphila TaxID=89065 RepID=A0A1G8MR15_9PSED|nr:transporter substrate-binding domain-containing protein [Pseudomonas abietaniphila]SDI70306.1 polar amino acid transport system substrate-binding protein [Pseudomonas abietaniphila]
MGRVRMKWLLGLSLLMMTGVWVQASDAYAGTSSEKPSDIVLVSEQWNGYTETDGSGLGWDLMREIFEPAGIKVALRTEPYTRAVGLVQRGEADAWVGAYEHEVEGTLYPKWHYDTDEIYALGLASNPVPALKTLGSYRLAWVRGYEYQHYLPNVVHFNEVARRDHILPMLDHARADLYIDARPEVDFILRQASEPQRFRTTYLMSIPLFLSFADNARGRFLRDVFDQRMAQLVHSGKLRPIFARWKQPYPFDADDAARKTGARQ